MHNQLQTKSPSRKGKEPDHITNTTPTIATTHNPEI